MRKESQSCCMIRSAPNALKVPCYDGIRPGTRPVSSTHNHRQGSCAGLALGSSTTHGVPSSTSNSTPDSTMQSCESFQWSSCWQPLERMVGVTHCCICLTRPAASILSVQHISLNNMTETQGPKKCYFKRNRTRAREAGLYVM